MDFSVMNYYDELADFFEEERQSELYNILDAVNFKLNRNEYHLNNIKRIVSSSMDTEQSDYYQSVHLPIYYEIEGFLVSLRSSVDILLHLINFCFDFELNSNEIYLNTIYHHPKLPKTLKNIFDRYTRPYNNPVWSFIYSFRNEIVHEKSIHQVLPVSIDLFSVNEPIAFMNLGEGEKEVTSFFGNCIRFMDNFSAQTFESIKVSM